jgi:thiol-disulfide isomerase/thioredoxin
MKIDIRPVAFRRRPRLFFGLSQILIAFVLALAVGTFPGLATPRVGRMPKDEIANQQLRTLDGANVSLAGLRGQVVVLDFFTTWCGHSRLHIQTVKRLHEEGSNLRIVGLAVQETETSTRQYVTDQAIKYPVTMISDPTFGSFVESRDVSVPQTLVYGRDGRLAAHFIGHSPEVVAELEKAVKREMAKP